MTRNLIPMLAITGTLALGGCGGGGGDGNGNILPPDAGGSPDAEDTLGWLLPPTSPPSSDARTTMLDAWDRSTVGEIPGAHQSLGSASHGGSGCCSITETFEPGFEWGYWARDDLHPGIIKVQRRPAPGWYEPGPHSGATRMLVGFLEYGYFDIGEDSETFGATYSLNDQPGDVRGPGSSYQRFRNYPEIFHLNATWRGDAFAMEKATRFPVVGPAELTITSVDTSRRGKYGLSFVAELSNQGVADQVRFDVSSEFLSSQNDDDLFQGPFRFEFRGNSAEEVFGVFQDETYYGSFGLIAE